MPYLADNIFIETIEATHTLPLPNEYERTFTLPSVVATNAQGASFVQKLSDTPIREWAVTWAAMSDSELDSMQGVWDCLSSQVCRYVDIFGDEYAIVRHPDQPELDASEIVIQGAPRYRVTAKWRQSSDAWEV